MIPYFAVDVSSHGRTPDTIFMTYIQMSHRYGPVTTARLLAGDTVERYSRDQIKIVGMRMLAVPDAEGPL